MLAVLAAIGVAPPPTLACPPTLPLSYWPADVGWVPALFCLINIVAGVACVGVLGGWLNWSADDPAPLRPLWIGGIGLGFLASAVGLYIAFANQSHTRAVQYWLEHTSAACMRATGTGIHVSNLSASTTRLSVAVGTVALVLIAIGITGAILERRRNRPRPEE
ncbi:MAG TPA: hypothetical protein VGR57_03480 [Ktedonobacterales bacterium]|nr:hypothetical protein [Ktedonobacterales bacterium]